MLRFTNWLNTFTLQFPHTSIFVFVPAMCRKRGVKKGERKPHNQGFQGFANLLNMDPDRFLMVFNRFDQLAMHNLVYLQGELFDLKQKFDFLNAEDSLGKPSFSWNEIEENGSIPTTRPYEEMTQAQRRFFLIKKIRQRMAEYREALLQQARLNELDSPIAKTLESIYSVKKSQEEKNAAFKFPDFMGKLYKEEKIRDLVSLRSPVVQDSWVSGLDSWKRFSCGIKRDESHMGLNLYSYDDVVRRANVVYVTLALVGIIAPTFALYAIGRHVSRNAAPRIELALAGVLTAVFFRFCLLFKMGRAELLGTAASYLGVLLIFLSLNLPD
ncbi:uncharacterized protein PV07_09925 [Cladophialophora immunda]|uniref:DUF6594 domain-containing protein n=1 Tax=Cladophialophora immunda TaxID=569365 RepID=A0A0D2AH46_9EURO|nr:uncharacterized protein PV07_09925 [Cladophialophora immunda]KIW24197.1 hypothetical protein PV07_09925 [Cladophialophora immunda]